MQAPAPPAPPPSGMPRSLTIPTQPGLTFPSSTEPGSGSIYCERPHSVARAPVCARTPWAQPVALLQSRGVKLFLTGATSASVAFQGPNVTVGLCKCKDSVTAKRELGAAAR